MSLTGTFAADSLIAGSFPIVTDEGTILTGQTLARGAVLGKITSGGKLQLLDRLATDGSQNPHSILAEAVDSSGGDVLKAPVYLCGEYNDNIISLGATTVAADIKTACRALSIFLKTPVKA